SVGQSVNHAHNGRILFLGKGPVGHVNQLIETIASRFLLVKVKYELPNRIISSSTPSLDHYLSLVAGFRAIDHHFENERLALFWTRRKNVICSRISCRITRPHS